MRKILALATLGAMLALAPAAAMADDHTPQGYPNTDPSTNVTVTSTDNSGNAGGARQIGTQDIAPWYLQHEPEQNNH